MDKLNEVRLYVKIDGHVQGVGFRYFVLEKAIDLNITGWVCNTYQGQVEVIAEGSRSQLEKLLTYLNRGPAGAHVADIESQWGISTGEYSDFIIQQTH